MADFCKQCSEIMFGKDFGDLKGLTPPELMVEVLCEGCGYTFVDSDGRCIKTEEHGHLKPPYLAHN